MTAKIRQTIYNFVTQEKQLSQLKESELIALTEKFSNFLLNNDILKEEIHRQVNHDYYIEDIKKEINDINSNTISTETKILPTHGNIEQITKHFEEVLEENWYYCLCEAIARFKNINK